MPTYVFHSSTRDLLLYKRKNSYRLILRDITTGNLVRGQWLLHSKIYPESCAFNGRYFIYFYMDLHDHHTYTVLCTPPYFTAHVLWSGIGTWIRGISLSEDTIRMDQRSIDLLIKGQVPVDMQLIADNSVLCTEVVKDEQDFVEDKFEKICIPEGYNSVQVPACI